MTQPEAGAAWRGPTFSVEKFHRVLTSAGFAVSRDALHQFLGHIEDCFLIRLSWVGDP